VLTLTDDERTSGFLMPETVQATSELLRTQGYVVFDRLLTPERVEELLGAFDPLFDAYLSRSMYRTGANRARMYLPFESPFIGEDVIASPVLLPVLRDVLGEGMRCTYFASDTPLPGSQYQNAHSDIAPLFPDVSVSLPTYALVVNIPLVDVTEENGPLEIWPGTHLNPEWSAHVTLDGSVGPHLDIVRAAARMRSERVLMPAGGAVIRDSRCWHRGTPNLSGARRPNLALVYHRHWFGAGHTIPIPQDTYGGLSPVARALFRAERIGDPVRLPWDWDPPDTRR